MEVVILKVRSSEILCWIAANNCSQMVTRHLKTKTWAMTITLNNISMMVKMEMTEMEMRGEAAVTIRG